MAYESLHVGRVPAGEGGRMTTCEALIDLQCPIRSDRVRAFQPPWRTVFVYRCPSCGAERHVRANSYQGKRAVLSVGAIRCGAMLPACGEDVDERTGGSGRLDATPRANAAKG